MHHFGFRQAAQVVHPWERCPPPIRRWSGVEIGQVEAALNTFSDIHTLLRRIESSAQESLRTRDYLRALWKYNWAVSVCVHCKQSKSLPVLCTKCAHVALLLKGPDELDSLLYAYKHAYFSTKTKPGSEEAHYIIAEAARRLIMLGKCDFIASTSPVEDAISDYYKCFAINPERVDTLVEAMALAVDYGLGDSPLVLSSDSALNGTGMKALNYILKHIENEPSSRFNSTHLKHFLFNMVPPAVMLGDASIELCSLMKRGITDVDVLSRMVQIGTRFRIKDLKELVLIADESDNLIDIISLSMSCFTMSNAHLKSAAEVAIKVKKFKFLACLIKHGAAPATTGVVSLTNLIDPVIINYIFANASPDKVAHFLLEALSLKTNEEGLHFTGGGQRCEVDWGEEIENEQRKAAWIVEQFRDFVQCGKSLCGKGTVAGIREILSLVLNCDATKAHLELVCQLLNCGANSLDLCRARFKKTTPLHAATMLALESGSTEIISIVVKSADFKLPQDGRVIDDNGDCPYHLVVKSNSDDDIKLKVGIALSELHPPLDPTVKDTAGKNSKGRQAKEYVQETSEMFKYLITAELRFALVHISSESALSGVLPELKKARDIWECVGIMENAGLLAEVVEILEMVGMREEAIKQALKYEKNGTNMANLSAECLAHKYARLYSTQKDVASLETYLGYIPDHIAKAKYWKRCGQYEKAIEVYVENKELERALGLMSYLGWYDRGLELARKEGNKKWIVSFAVEKAKASLHDHGVLDTSILECLHGLLRDTELRCHNKLLPIINLLVGCGDGKAEHIIKAAKMFEEQGNIIGELECCIQLLHILKGDAILNDNCRRKMLRSCFIAQQHANILAKVAREDALALPVQRAFQLALVFYGVHPSGSAYRLHLKQSIWIGGDLKLRQMSDGSIADDGMVRLDITKTKQHFIGQLGNLSSLLLGDNNVKSKLQADLCREYNVKVYKGSTGSLLLKPDALLMPDHLRRFVSVHINWLEYCSTAELSTDGPLCQLLNLFSPNVSPHLPSGLLHLKLMRSSPLVCKCIFNWLLRTLDSMATEEEYRADVWLMLWKASCIVGKGGGELRTLVKGLSEKVDDNDVVPVPYLLLDSSYIHQFEFWLEACDLICNKGEVISAAECVIKYFLSHVAITSKRGSQIMVMNVVEILSIYCTALLCVIMRSQHKMGRRAPMFAMPSLYIHVIQIFDDLNTHRRGGYRLLEACVHQAEMWPEDSFKRLSSKACILLKQSLDLLLCVLKFASHDAQLLSAGVSCHCLILSLTIVANLVPLSRHDPTSLLHRFVGILKESNIPGCPHYITEAYNIMSLSDWGSNVLKFIYTLANQYNLARPGLAQMTICGDRIKLGPVEFRNSVLQEVYAASDYDVYSLKPLDGFEELQQAYGDTHKPELGQSPAVLCEDYQEVGDSSVTSVQYCCPCSLHLECSQMQQHIGTMEHQEKAQLFQTYHIVESECLQLQQRLLTVVEKLQSGDDCGNHFAKLIHEMEEEMEQNSSIFDSIRWQSSWESGIQELKQMKERMDMLCQLGAGE